MADKPQILIVEDDLDLSDMLTQFFETQGYDVRHSAWGEEALRFSREQRPDLVMLDVHLPDIDGYEICRRLRSSRRTEHVPVIFLTEKRDRANKLTGLELGGLDYITKPFDLQELRLRVRNLLRRAEAAPRMNAITNLPDQTLTDEKLTEALYKEPGWAALYISVLALDSFRDEFGFVAADDVLRGVALILNNAIREAGSGADFIGHLSAAGFIVLTDGAHMVAIRDRIEGRLRRSLNLFQPAREMGAQTRLALRTELATASDGQPYATLDVLKAKLGAALANPDRA